MLEATLVNGFIHLTLRRPEGFVFSAGQFAYLHIPQLMRQQAVVGRAGGPTPFSILSDEGSAELRFWIKAKGLPETSESA